MEIGIIVICLLLSAFFSGMEIAYVSSNKVYLSIEKRQLNFNATILNKLIEKPSQFITSMLVGNNVVLVIYGIYLNRKNLILTGLSAIRQSKTCKILQTNQLL